MGSTKKSAPGNTKHKTSRPDGSAWVAQQLRWFRRLAHLGCGTAFISICLNVVLGLAVLGLWGRIPPPRYFAVTPHLRIMRIDGRKEPVLRDGAIRSWMARAVTQTLNLDFVHWRHQLSSVRGDYTHKAFVSMIESLQKSGDLDYIRKKRLSVSATPTRAPIIAATGHIGSVKEWKVQMPILLSFESSQGVVNTQHWIASVLIKQVSTLKYPNSIAIAQIVLCSNGGSADSCGG